MKSVNLLSAIRLYDDLHNITGRIATHHECFFQQNVSDRPNMSGDDSRDMMIVCDDARGRITEVTSGI